MLVRFPDILRKERDQWDFSEKEPWKPVAKESASKEVKEAIAEFVSLMTETDE